MNYRVTRRDFVNTGMASAALSASVPKRAQAQKNPAEFAWGALWHMGTNMWSDLPIRKRGNGKTDDVSIKDKADYLRFDESVWRTLTARMKAAGMNQVVIDLGEALRYESHPELAVEGSWSIAKFRAELARLRAMGIEPIPKLNFSTAHNTWLKEYSRKVSTPIYYKVCANLIREVCDIFDKPRLFHLGYDEETARHQRRYQHVIIRQGDLWWHDLLHLVKEVEKWNARPWLWSDYCWDHPEEFVKRMPKSVLQSNWYYASAFDPAKSKYVKAYLDLEKAGFDQVPTGSNWSSDVNFKLTVAFCEQHIAPQRLKGFLMAPWLFTLPKWREKNLQAIAQVEEVIRGG